MAFIYVVSFVTGSAMCGLGLFPCAVCSAPKQMVLYKAGQFDNNLMTPYSRVHTTILSHFYFCNTKLSTTHNMLSLVTVERRGVAKANI